MTISTTGQGDHRAQARASFVEDIAVRAELPPHATAESIASAVMCTLTERLTSGGAHRLLSALPASIRPLFARCLEHRGGPVRRFGRAEMLERIADHLGVTSLHAEELCQAVLAAVRLRVSAEVADRIAAQLPEDLKELWLTPVPPIAARRVADPDELERVRATIYADIEQSGALPAGSDGAEAFVAVMCIFSRRLSGGQARNLLLALPNTLRPLVGACMLHRSEAALPFGEWEFVRHVAEHLETTPELATRLVQAVFAAAKRSLPERDIEDAASQLPVDLRTLWLAS